MGMTECRMAEWRDGGMAEWRDGGMAEQYFTTHLIHPVIFMVHNDNADNDADDDADNNANNTDGF